MTTQYSRIADRFEVREPLGTGGMGRVWLGFDHLLCRPVALKEVVPPRGLPDHLRDSLTDTVFREARAAAQIDHPGVVRVYDVIRWGRWPWIVMQYVPSRTLQSMIKVDGPVSPEYAIQIGLSLVEALIAIHRAGVLHRDVTPGNVFITRDGKVMLGDFGLALRQEDTAADDSTTMGTASYIAPERAISGTSGPAGDCWSLGATLFAAVEGRPPFRRSSATASITAMVTSPLDPLRNAGLLGGVIQGLLTVDPGVRMTALQARHALRQLAAAPPWGALTDVGAAVRDPRVQRPYRMAHTEPNLVL